MHHIPVANNNWKDWKWQLKNSVHDLESFERLAKIQFPPDTIAELKKTIEHFPLSVTPYYISLIDPENYENDPIFKQCFPSIKELDIASADIADPLSEDMDSPTHLITHRYPDRILFHVSNQCAMYCRHCTRKRKVGDKDQIPKKKEIIQGLEYIKRNTTVRDVLLSGGDPFMLSDEYLDWILTEVKKIPHVEVVRIGTRVPVVLPYRITPNLLNILKKHSPLWINTHFNHPREFSRASLTALASLADAGIPLGNQTVLLAGVNDCVFIMKKLMHKLVQNRVRPYYLYQCDLSTGLSHFRTPISKGIEVIESLRGHTSGFAVPTFVVDAPGGGGKIPLMPQYQLSSSPNKVVLRNFEGVITTYEEPRDYDYRQCDLDCHSCKLFLKADMQANSSPVGIKKLLADFDDEISLIPHGTERMEKRIAEDAIIQIGRTILQHGKKNDRVYLMHLGTEPVEKILVQIESLALNNGYSKIFAKVPHSARALFEEDGYLAEAAIPNMYNGTEDGVFMSKFYSEARKTVRNAEQCAEVLQNCQQQASEKAVFSLPHDYLLTRANVANAPELAKLYGTVFKSYPFPIHQEDYLVETMADNTEYYCIWKNAQLVAAASMEKSPEGSYAEMTDFAVIPEFRGNKFSHILLGRMEKSAAKQHIRTVFTIARAISLGMNTCFAQCGYVYAGMLRNNTSIDNELESMNVWYATLPVAKHL